MHASFEGTFDRAHPGLHRGRVTVLLSFLEGFATGDTAPQDFGIDQQCVDALARNMQFMCSFDFHGSGSNESVPPASAGGFIDQPQGECMTHPLTRMVLTS